MKKLFVVLVMLAAIDASGQWQPDVRLTDDPAVSYTSNNNAWCIAASGSVVHVVWEDNRDGNLEIYYKRSTDAGVSWGADTRLTNNNANSYAPSIAVSGSVVHVVWYDYRDGNDEIYYKRSTDAGVSWGADMRMTNSTTYDIYPSIAVSGSDVHVVWQDYNSGDGEIYYKRSTDSGVSWGANINLTNTIEGSSYPSVAVSGLIVHVVWMEYTWYDNEEIHYKCSTDAGVNWGADVRLTNNTATSALPSVAVSGSVVHVVWQENRNGNNEIYYKRSTDAGVNWGADIRLTNNATSSLSPSIAVSGSNVHLVWEDVRNGNWVIYYKRSTDAGVNWEADTWLTNNTSEFENTNVSVSGSNVHVVWYDDRDGNYEIYYKRNPTGFPTGIENINSKIASSCSLSQNYPNPIDPTKQFCNFQR